MSGPEQQLNKLRQRNPYSTPNSQPTVTHWLTWPRNTRSKQIQDLDVTAQIWGITYHEHFEEFLDVNFS